VAVGAGGQIAVTWLDRRRDFMRAMAAFGSVAGFGAPVVLDTASFAYPVEAAFDGSGDLALAWSAQSQPGGPTWTVKVIHRSPDGALGALQEAGSGYAYDVRVARTSTGATGVSWIGNSGPESGTLGPTETAIAPAGGPFDGPVSPEPGNSRTLGARVAAVGESLVAIYTTRHGPLRATVRRPGAGFGPAAVLSAAAAQEPELDGGLASWSQPRTRMARLLPDGSWARLAPPGGIPSDPLRATAAAGLRVLVAWVDARGRLRAAVRTL
jgi:hypothetical protein